jgi:hypothetical protein
MIRIDDGEIVSMSHRGKQMKKVGTEYGINSFEHG